MAVVSPVRVRQHTVRSAKGSRRRHYRRKQPKLRKWQRREQDQIATE